MATITNLSTQIKVIRNSDITTFYNKLDANGNSNLLFAIESGDIVLLEGGDTVETFDYSVVNLPTSSDIQNLIDKLNGFLFSGSLPFVAQMKTGTYTGDGTTAMAITGIGFAPKYVKIIQQLAGDLLPNVITETWDTIIDDNASGMAFIHSTAGTLEHASYVGGVVTLDADGFTVGDRTANLVPNGVGLIYNYIVFG